MSHFTVTAYTDDIAYGQSDCRSLAYYNPDYAIDNADNHAYMAENIGKYNKQGSISATVSKGKSVE